TQTGVNEHVSAWMLHQHGGGDGVPRVRERASAICKCRGAVSVPGWDLEGSHTSRRRRRGKLALIWERSVQWSRTVRAEERGGGGVVDQSRCPERALENSATGHAGSYPVLFRWNGHERSGSSAKPRASWAGARIISGNRCATADMRKRLSRTWAGSISSCRRANHGRSSRSVMPSRCQTRSPTRAKRRLSGSVMKVITDP